MFLYDWEMTKRHQELVNNAYEQARLRMENGVAKRPASPWRAFRTWMKGSSSTLPIDGTAEKFVAASRKPAKTHGSKRSA